MLKALERVAKMLLAFVVGILLWVPRSWRRPPPVGPGKRKVLLVRIDARVGEALLTTPLPQAILSARPEWEVTLLVHPRCVSMVTGAPGVSRVLPFARKRLWLGAAAPEIRALRRETFDVVVDASNWTAPSVTSAIVSRLIASSATAFGRDVPGCVVGPAHPILDLMRDVTVHARYDTRSEVLQRLHLLAPLLGEVPETPLAFRTLEPAGMSAEEQALAATPYAVVNPGGRLGWRRVPPAVFADAARWLLGRGLRVVVTWGPGEEVLARQVIAEAPGAELAPLTSLDALAWILSRARLSVCNNTGPMHLSVAVGTPTVGLFLHMELQRWGHVHPPHRMVDLTPQPGNEEAPDTGPFRLHMALRDLFRAG